MTNDTTLNLSEKRALGASFFVAVGVLDKFADVAIRRHDPRDREALARKYADELAARLVLNDDSLRSDFAKVEESHLGGLLKDLRNIPEAENNKRIVAVDMISRSKYYLVSLMFDHAEALEIMNRNDMRDTKFGNVIPPRPEFPQL